MSMFSSQMMFLWICSLISCSTLQPHDSHAELQNRALFYRVSPTPGFNSLQGSGVQRGDESRHRLYMLADRA